MKFRLNSATVAGTECGVWLLIALLFLTPAAVMAQVTHNDSSVEPNDVETEVRSLLERQVEAWNRGDLEAFMETYWNSPELTFSGGGQTTRGWQATLDRYRERYGSREAMGTLRFADFEMQLLGDSAALVLGTWHLRNDRGEPHGNFSLVLRKMEEGQWVIIHDHSSTAESGE